MADKEPTKIARLEQALAVWEERMWALEMLSRYERERDPKGNVHTFQHLGPIAHHRELRQHLLSLRSATDFDCDRFQIMVDGQGKAEAHQSGIFATLLAGWTLHSRRVYHLDQDLQALLSATSLGRLTLQDIRMPFEAFGISLEQPIRSAKTEDYDFLLVSPCWSSLGREKIEQVTSLGIQFLSTRLGSWRPLPQRAHLEKVIARGRIKEAIGDISSYVMNEANSPLFDIYLVSDNREHKVAQVLEHFEQEQHLHVRNALRVAFGLCAYLSTLPPGSPHLGSWRPPEKIRRPSVLPDKLAITQASQVCSVTSIRKLSDEDRGMLFGFSSGRGGYEVSAHFRCGYWHRPRGTGHNPEQPKTLWTQPTMVRRDRLPEGAVPGGSKVVLSPQK